MLLNSVVIILREVLEAVLVLSLLLNISHYLGVSKRWFYLSLLLGFIAAFTYAMNYDVVSDYFDGLGQEIASGASLIIVFVCLAAITPALSGVQLQGFRRLSQYASFWAISLLLCHEGAEIFVYMSGALAQPEKLSLVLAGASIGLGIGVSMGVFFYHSIHAIPAAKARWCLLILLALVAAGMSLQASQFLLQADLLPTTAVLWDSSAWLPESSIIGQLLYALLAYEASPSRLQVDIYSACLAAMLLLPVVVKRVLK